jgi:hypothetical protein
MPACAGMTAKDFTDCIRKLFEDYKPQLNKIVAAQVCDATMMKSKLMLIAKIKN